MNFTEASDRFMQDLETRSTPCRRSTIKSYDSILRVHLKPRFGAMQLADFVGINNRLLREFVRELRQRYRPATIRLLVTVLQNVVDYPRDDNGSRLFKCEWNLKFADLPAVVPAKQHAPMIRVEELNRIVAERQDGLLYAVLAGTGMRISEALALTNADWNRDAAILSIRAGKTAASVREIDLPLSLNDKMRSLIEPDQVRLFPLHITTARARARGITGAFHGFRRFRLTHLRMSGMPEDLVMFYMGHASRTITDRYSRIRLNREFRREWTERAELGFSLGMRS